MFPVELPPHIELLSWKILDTPPGDEKKVFLRNETGINCLTDPVCFKTPDTLRH
jgi:hypothetical protein